MTEILCTNCHSPYPAEGAPFRCPKCAGVFDFPVLPIFKPDQVDENLPRMWRYWHSFGLTEDTPLVTLGEGDTPLVWGNAFGRRIAFKLEYLNPTGSYKDRGAAVLTSFLLSRGVQSAVEDSSGNAGASFSAYAARAGISATIYIPEYASGLKRMQIERYGAEIVTVTGPRSNASEAVMQAVEHGVVYASHAYMPHSLAGYATIAYEIFADLGQTPGAVIAPVGQGNLLLAIGRGFVALKDAGMIARLPRLIGVQALACAPIWSVYRYGASGLGWVTEGETVAEGVRVKHPLRGDALLHAITTTGGSMIAVDENEILPGRDRLARMGFFVEPTSAIVWSALAQMIRELPDPVVVILTGSGLKSQ